jgi:hypothetical protein
VAPVSSARSPVSFIPAAGLLVALFAVFGGGAVLVSNTLHQAGRGATSTPAAAPHAAPTVPTPGASHRHDKKRHGTASPGSSYATSTSTGQAGKKTSHQASPTPAKSKHSTQPSSQPATTPASTPSTTPPASPTPTDTSTGTGAAGGSSNRLIGSIIGLLSAV